MDTYKPRLRVASSGAREEEPSSSSQRAERPERPDGRTPGALRPLHMKIGVITQASGSAFVESAGCKVICGVYGPKQTNQSFSEKGKLWCDFRYGPFATESRRSQKGQEQDERQLSLVLTEAIMMSVQLDKFPKSIIECHVCALESSNVASTMAAAIISISLALTNAGIDMYDLVAACTVGDYGGTSILDPSIEEEKSGQYQGGMMVSRMASLGQLTYLQQWGSLRLPKVKELSELCIDGCARVYELMRDALVEAAKKQLSPSTPKK